MKRIILIGFVWVFATMSSFECSAQKMGELLLETESMDIYGMWKPSKCLKKDSPKMLCLTAVNKSEEAQQATYQVVFFESANIIEKSPGEAICVKAGKKLKGRSKGMCILPAEVTNEQVLSSDFSVEIVEFEVEAVEGCE